jgi:hypothetical protein
MTRDQEELEALRELLPVPGERDFPAGRREQRADHLMGAWLQLSREAGNTPRPGAAPAAPGRRPLRMPMPMPMPLSLARGRMPLVGAVALTAVLTLVITLLLPGTGGGTAVAATPKPLVYHQDGRPEDASRELEAIAARAAAGPEVPAGGTEHFRYREWSLSTAVGRAGTASAVVESQYQKWITDDGAGRIYSRRGAPAFHDNEARETWRAAGLPTGPSAPHRSDSRPGGLRMWDGRPPADPEALADWLAEDHPRDNGPAEVLTAITDLERERVLRPAERAAVLRVLAGVPGLVYEGSTTDRAGRRGKAFALHNTLGGLPNRWTLVLDPVTGKILGEEVTLTESAGELRVPVPSVISYTVHLEAVHRPLPERAPKGYENARQSTEARPPA